MINDTLTVLLNDCCVIERYQAFISGCDDGAAVSGISHKIFDVSNQDIASQASSFLNTAAAAAQQGVRVLGGRQLGTLIVVALQFFGSLFARILVRIPLIGAFGGAFVGFRKIIRPWYVLECKSKTTFV
mgnify:CR=1 FL=1